MKNKAIKEKEDKLVNMVSAFCDEKLDDEYKHLCEKLVRKMGRKEEVPFKRGKLEIWASSIVYVIGHLNFLFDPSFEPYTTADEICKYFGTKKGTIYNKSIDIRKKMNLKMGDSDFSTKIVLDSNIKEEDSKYNKSLKGAKNKSYIRLTAEIIHSIYDFKQ